MLWAKFGISYIGIPDDGGIIHGDPDNPADMSGIRCYVIGTALDEKMVGYWQIVAIRDDASILDIAKDLADYPAMAIENLKRVAEEHDQGLLHL